MISLFTHLCHSHAGELICFKLLVFVGINCNIYSILWYFFLSKILLFLFLFDYIIFKLHNKNTTISFWTKSYHNRTPLTGGWNRKWFVILEDESSRPTYWSTQFQVTAIFPAWRGCFTFCCLLNEKEQFRSFPIKFLIPSWVCPTFITPSNCYHSPTVVSSNAVTRNEARASLYALYIKVPNSVWHSNQSQNTPGFSSPEALILSV